MSVSLNLPDKQKVDNEDFYYYTENWLEIKIDEISNKKIENLNEKEKLAFYINSYNILTLWNVNKKTQNNPAWKGNKNLLSRFRFFVLSKFTVAGKKINLYNLENKILRKKFNDPRIHFAINCASVSCPPLPEKQLNGFDLDSQLDRLTKAFINDGYSVQYDAEQRVLMLNPIFKWYKKDFKKDGGIIPFLNKYFEGKKFSLDVKIKFQKYDWSLKV
jgi:hypothetical protein